MRIDGRDFRTIWAGDDGASVNVIDQKALPHRFAVKTWRGAQEACEGIADMTVRGAPLIGAAGAYGVALAMAADPSDTEPRGRLRQPPRRAADGREPALGARPHARSGSRRCGRRSVRAPLLRKRHRSPTRMSPPARRSANTARADRRRCLGQGRPVASRPGSHALQRGLARHGRLGHRARADLQGAPSRHPRPRLGRRNAAAQPGRQPHGLGTLERGRAAHDRGRQRRRALDAARPRRSLHRRHRPHHADRGRLQQDRHLPEGAGRARQRRAVLRGPAVLHYRLADRATAWPTSRSRSGPPTRSRS